MLEIVPLSKKSNSKRPKDEKVNITKYVARMDENLSNEIHNLYVHFCHFCSRMDSLRVEDFKAKENIHTLMRERSKLLLKGFLNTFKEIKI